MAGNSRWSDVRLADPVRERQAAILLLHILSLGYLLLYTQIPRLIIPK